MSSKHDAVEAQSKALRDDRRREEDEARGTKFGQEILDTEVYEENARSGYLNYLPGTNDDDDEDEEYQSSLSNMKLKQYGPTADIRQNIPNIDQNFDPLAEHRRPTIADRENEYQKKRRMVPGRISPERLDYFADGGKTPDPQSKARSYAEIMGEVVVRNAKADTRNQIAEKVKAAEAQGGAGANGSASSLGEKRRRRWDQTAPTDDNDPKAKKTAYDEAVTPAHRIWDATPAPGQSSFDETPHHSTTPSNKRNRWDETPRTERETANSGWAETPKTERGGMDDADYIIRSTPTPSTDKRRSRWDETPANQTTTNGGSFTPTTKEIGVASTPRTSSGFTPGMTPIIATPVGARAANMATPTPNQIPMTPEQMQAYRWEREIDERNRPLSDEELDAMFPPGYKVLPPPASYIPIRTPARKLTATPTPQTTMSGFHIQESAHGQSAQSNQLQEYQPSGNLPLLKPDDLQYFDKLLQEVDEEALTPEEQKERKIMKLLLKIKNGTPPMRKAALRQITDKAREFGAGPLFNQILPLLMSPTLEDQERHLLVKVIDRILYKLDDLVRPYVHKICVVIEPLLIDEDYYARVEGREIISNLAKAAGLATMISTMRPDIDNLDEYVRNTTARAFAVVASALGIPALLPFLKAVCKSKKSWQARHTGIKIIQQIAILLGCAILPHLKSLVEIIEHGLVDEQQKVRTITALGIAALAEAAAPYGIESFDTVLKPLWNGIKQHRGKGLAAFLKAIGYLIPLMDAEYAGYYTREVMVILIREFQSPDEEMKKIVLKVVKQCTATDGVEAKYIKEEVLPAFFRYFWNQRMALDRRNYRQLVDTTVEMANKVGSSEIINRIVDDLKDESEQYRKMVIETIEKIMTNLGSADIDSRLEEQLIDGILYAFQEQTTEDTVMLNGFGAVVNSLGKRCKAYLPQICGTILWRLNNKAAKVRQQAADLIQKIANVMKLCQEEKLMGQLGLVLYEYLGEEYPEVLGSILGALKGIVNVIGMTNMTPPIKDLLPRLTPILKNRHEKVQENCIDLVGRIAELGAEHVPAREWMRICFELLELLKAHKKSIRRAAINTFGYIAKAIGPHDVLATLLNNLKVQERQLRVCTTVAIAIVSETCSPFTVLPGLMNEYRVPELNVQNGVLKALAFMFEYIGEMSKDYIYAVTPLLEDAMMDRDLVHRQTAMTAIGHMSLGVFGFGCEDALCHLLNHVWPNIFETSPHVIQAFISAIEGLRVGLGPCRILYYALQGLFHPARRVRDVYWKVYNTLYIGAQDSLIISYPRIVDDSTRPTIDEHESLKKRIEKPRNDYLRYELDYIL
ncbi:unnamed protein product [Adineta steineri]|uniref:Splicing factor 3B subunit 1 n=1 Tax=Adineta steineri TaxID=433720 RepID=A0A818R2T4_9BILA|nr:unnamed protein product [Adineta steineri]